MDILQFSDVPASIFEQINTVHKAVFEGEHLKEHKLQGKNNLLVLVAIIDEQVAGFKMGYKVEDGIFYSWLGGVSPNFQQCGVAKTLMEKQHELLKEQGYRTVRTFSRNERRAMLLLNIKSGFDIIDTFTDKKGVHKIRLEKNL